MEYDDNRTFPLCDAAINCKGYLTDIINCEDSLRNEVQTFYKKIIENTFLLEINYPVWFINQTVYEEKYSYLNTCKICNEGINYFNKFGLYIYLSEPLNFFQKNNYIKNKLLTILSEFAYKNKLTNVTIFTCECNVYKLEEHYDILKFACKDIFLTLISLRIIENLDLGFDFEHKKQQIGKKFWCGNILYSFHRHCMIAYLINRSGNYSWSHKEDFKKIQNSSNIVNQVAKKQKKILLKNNKTIQKNSPYIMDGFSFSGEDSIKKYYDECFCAIVTETNFSVPYGNISEKTFYAIAYGKPFILVAPYRSLNYLKNLGFKTFDHFWDESYDDIEDPVKRIVKIYDVIDCLDNMSVTELKQLYQQMLPILKHNIKVLKEFPYQHTVLR